jgi:hypothetical protein
MAEIIVEADKPEPLDLKAIARKAAADFGLSMIDDRSFWTHPQSITAEQVLKLCTETARENAGSAVSQKLGKLIEAITASVDLAYNTDGALADFDTIIASYAKDLVLDFSAWPGTKAPWDDKIMAVRAALNAVLTLDSIGEWLAPITVAQLLGYANKDERLHGEDLRKAIAALNYPGASVSADPTDPGDIPAFLDRRNKQEASVAKKTKVDAAGWDDEPGQTTDVQAQAEAPPPDNWDDEPAPAEAADPWADPWADPEPVAENKGVRGATHHDTGISPKLCIMADLAGVSNDVMAVLLSQSRPYYSMIKSGKRKFPGLTTGQKDALLVELNQRMEAIKELATELMLGEITKPGV